MVVASCSTCLEVEATLSGTAELLTNPCSDHLEASATEEALCDSQDFHIPSTTPDQQVIGALFCSYYPSQKYA
jgi:hypothetical protein